MEGTHTRPAILTHGRSVFERHVAVYSEIFTRTRFRPAEFTMAPYPRRRDHIRNVAAVLNYILALRGVKPIDGKCHSIFIPCEYARLHELVTGKEFTAKRDNVLSVRRTLQRCGILKYCSAPSFTEGKATTYFVDYHRARAYLHSLRVRGLLPKTPVRHSSKSEREAYERLMKLASRNNRASELLEELNTAASTGKPFTLLPCCGMTVSQLHNAYNYALATASPLATATSSSTAEYNATATATIGKVLLSTENDRKLANLAQNSQNCPKLNCDLSAVSDVLGLHFRPHAKFWNGTVSNPSWRVYSGLALMERGERRVCVDGICSELGLEAYEYDRTCSIHNLHENLHSGTYSPCSDIYARLFRMVYHREMSAAERTDWKRMVSRYSFSKSMGHFVSSLAYSYSHALQTKVKVGSRKEIRPDGRYRYRAEYRWVGEYRDPRHLLAGWKKLYRSLSVAYGIVCGSPIGSDIFKYEGLLMVKVQQYLLDRYGILSGNVYDELVLFHDGSRSASELDALMDEASAAVFPEVAAIFRQMDGLDK